MFGFIVGIPRRIENLFSKFKSMFFTKPQYENFCRTEMGLIVAGQGEHDIKSINQLFIDRKDQSSLNRFLTKSQWNLQAVTRQAETCFLANEQLNRESSTNCSMTQ